MGYFHAASPGRSTLPTTSYRGRSSPSPHVRQQTLPNGHSAFSNPSSLCRAIGGNSSNNINGYTVSSPQRQPRQYVTPHSSPQSVVGGKATHRSTATAAAAPQDRKFRPITHNRSSPTTSSTPHPHSSSPSKNKRTTIPPADNKKYKMELCKNFLKGASCPFGASCHFAHGVAELNRPDPVELVRDGKLLYVCEIWASTGACPCGQRCKYLHDPNLSTTPTSTSTAWLRLNTKPSKKEQHIIPDPDHWHRMNKSQQENPVVDPFSWTKCRPDKEFNHADDLRDTCDMVWNKNVLIFPKMGEENGYYQAQQYGQQGTTARFGGGANSHVYSSTSTTMMSYSNIVRKTNNPTSQEATSLAIALAMVNPNVFLYSPTHCLNGQPCMILQTRYFRVVGGAEVVQEVSDGVMEYANASQSGLNDECVIVRADEVVFDSKGKRSCNRSIWFDTQFTPYICRKAKKSDKNDKNIWSSNKNDNSLFCMPNNEEFLQKLPVGTLPYMIMQPYGVDGFNLMKRILQYRIDELIGSVDNNKSSSDNSLATFKMSGIKDDFIKLANDLKRWKLPRTASLDHLARGEVNTPYTPSDPTCHAAKLYNSLVANMKNLDNGCTRQGEGGGTTSGRRLDIFVQISYKSDKDQSNDDDILPFIKSNHDDKDVVVNPDQQSIATETWQDLLLGIGGKWEQSMQTAMGEVGKKVNSHCASPSSAA